MTLEIPIRVELSDEEVNAALRDALRFYHWTPVTESLPDEEGYYLVTTENDCGTRKRQVSTFTRYDDIGYTWGIETSPVYKVLAWMPLPEIWEG